MTNSKAKILIVEDDLSSQQYYTVMLEEKYELYMVPTVKEAKQALKENVFKVAIIDISLPGGESGIDLIKFMHDKYPKNPDCIALTANAFPHIRAESLEAGASEFFTKPIMSDVLLQVVGKYVTRSKQKAIPIDAIPITP